MEYFKPGDMIYKIKYSGEIEQVDYSQIYVILAVRTTRVGKHSVRVKALLDDKTECILLENKKMYVEKIITGCCVCS